MVGKWSLTLKVTLKVGQRVKLKKNIPQSDFEIFGNEKNFVNMVKAFKFVTIYRFIDEGRAIALKEVPQYWKIDWFTPYENFNQLQFEFMKEDRDE